MDQKMEKNKNKTGLVLEGGGMRGIYTAGVLDVFLDEGLTFDGVIGVSAGAVHGCSFLSGQKGRSIRYYKKYCADKRFMSTENLIRTGNFVDTDFCYHELPEILDVYDYDMFNKNKEHTDFYAVCSDVEKGKPVYAKLHDMKRDIDYIRASASLPYVSKFVELDGRKLLDGGCTDSVPVEAFRRLGYKRNVVVLTRDSEYRKKPENAWMADIVYHKYPKFAEALKNRAVEYNMSIQAGKGGRSFRDPSERSSHDPEDLQERRGDRKDISDRCHGREEDDGGSEKMDGNVRRIRRVTEQS